MITDGNGMGPADFAAMMGNGMNGGMGGGGGFWFFVLFLILLMSGRGWGGSSGDCNCQNAGGLLQEGFNQQALMSGINGLSQGQAAAAQMAAANQMGMYQAINGMQAAQAQANADMSMAFQNCCCENRLATANLGAEIAREAAAGRSQTQATGQQIMDKLCQLELDGVKQNYESQIRSMQQNYDNQIRTLENSLAQLRESLTGARFNASQTAQTAQLESYINPQARPVYVVQGPGNCYGNQLLGNVA